MILLNPKLDDQIDEEVRDKNGRFLSAKITLDDCQIVLANVYAPNDINQQVLFFKEVQKITRQVCARNDHYRRGFQLRSFTKRQGGRKSHLKKVTGYTERNR